MCIRDRGNVVVRLLAKRGEWVRGLALPDDPAIPLPDGIEIVRGDKMCIRDSINPVRNEEGELLGYFERFELNLQK